MPELPSITVYCEALGRFAVGHTLERIRLGSPFLVRSVEPSLDSCTGLEVTGIARVGKRIVLELGLPPTRFLVLHLMIAGRLRWRKPDAKLPGKRGLAAFDFAHGTLVFTEASTKKRASLHVEASRDDVQTHDRGGVEVAGLGLDAFRDALSERNHTLKRGLTDPRILSGIGNAFSDEILFAAGLSPFKQSKHLDDQEWKRLHAAVVETLDVWTDRLRTEVGDGFPDKVTAFHDEMAVHGRYRQPCRQCGSKVQRIRYAENEANYCPGCQTENRLLADRSLSRLLKKDWPKTIAELESRKAALRD